MPQLSVIIPLFNKGPHIARTLNSILRQTFQDFEIIVVDDGSTDNGAEIVRSFEDPHICLIQQENRGVSAARNRGVDRASTEFITFLDADDEWMPSHLETILKLREKYPEAGMYATAYKIITSNGNAQIANYKFIPDIPWEGLLPNYFKSVVLGENSELLGEYPANASVVGIPKKIFIELGGFPQGYWFGEDTDLFGKIALKYPVAFSWEPGAIYHRDATNRACEKIRTLDYEEPFIKTARNALNKGEVAPEFIEPLNEFLSAKEIPRAVRNILAGNGKTARTILRQCKTKWQYRKKVKWTIIAMMPYPLLLFIQKQKKKIHNIITIRHIEMKKG